MYSVIPSGSCLTLVKDSRGRPAALVELSDTPCVEIRGNLGKKRIDEWLMRDNVNPWVTYNLLEIFAQCGIGISCLRFMIWGGEYYYWAIALDGTHVSLSSNTDRKWVLTRVI